MLTFHYLAGIQLLVESTAEWQDYIYADTLSQWDTGSRVFATGLLSSLYVSH